MNGHRSSSYSDFKPQIAICVYPHTVLAIPPLSTIDVYHLVAALPEMEFSPEDIKHGLISEGLSDSGATETTEFLFKDRSDDITTGELKTEFRQFLASLSKEDQIAIKGIINRELDKFFSEDDNSDSIFLFG